MQNGQVIKVKSKCLLYSLLSQFKMCSNLQKWGLWILVRPTSGLTPEKIRLHYSNLHLSFYHFLRGNAPTELSSRVPWDPSFDVTIKHNWQRFNLRTQNLLLVYSESNIHNLFHNEVSLSIQHATKKKK